MWYVNMTWSLARYSQLLLQDLSRDLMLISKKTESCRLSMVLLKSWTSPQGEIFYTAPLQSFHIPNIPPYRKSTHVSHLRLLFLYRGEGYPPQALIKDTMLDNSVSSCCGEQIQKVPPVCFLCHPVRWRVKLCWEDRRDLAWLVSEVFNPSAYCPLAVPQSPSSPS